MAFLVVRAVPADDPRNPWFSWEYIRQNSDSIQAALTQHVQLTVLAIAIAAAIAIPLAIVASRVRWLAGPILSLSGVLYTIPSLALFALLGPLLGLTVRTALVGLVMYALLAIVRNALTGLRQVPAEVRDAARGMGYGPAQLLWRIDLPLALPGILTGLRIATVSTVALVTVTSIVSYGGFGMEILTGFNHDFYRPQIMFATLACVTLALTFDLLLVLLGKVLMPWSRRRRAT
ncbi:ABC transporter permease [Luedemannella helvata]|uniref:ABC transmembrane type-1 domain-containing protein n=1 Tax=Luedemannella helvata TaxID=349315 RepID=A0ABP4WKT3_9ACTN